MQRQDGVDLQECCVGPFYLLVCLAGLLVANLVLSLLRLPRAGLRGTAFASRALLSARERGYLNAVEIAAGPGCRVDPKVAAAVILRPRPELGWGRRRASRRALESAHLDLLISAASDARPLCAVLLLRPEPSWAERASRGRIGAACTSAGLPVLELPLTEPPAPATLKRLVQEALETIDLRVAPPPPQRDEDEEAMLAELAAAMREPEALEQGELVPERHDDSGPRISDGR
jgi:hypothetical protein